MVFRNLVVSNSSNMISSAEFIAVGSDICAPYNYGDDIIIPYLDGICFSGVVNKTKKKQISFNSSSQKSLWAISCLGDFIRLKRERNSEIEKYEDSSVSSIISDIVGSDWSGDISDADTNPLKISYTTSGADKKTELSNVISQSGYDWRCRRPIYRISVAKLTEVSSTEAILEFTSPTPDDDELIGQALIMVSGIGTYVSSGYVVSNTGSSITLSNCVNMTSEYVSSGDTFIVTRHPVIDASPTFCSTDVVKEFTVNTDIFNFDYDIDDSSKYNAIVVTGIDPLGVNYATYLPAIYTVNAPGDWEDCTFIDNSSDDSTPDTYIVSVSASASTICVAGVNLNIGDSSGATEILDIGGDAFTVSVGGVTENPNNTTTIVLATFDTSNIMVGMPVLRRTIYVNDASKIVVSSVTGIGEVTIGNEVLDVTPDTTHNYLSVSSRQTSASRSHVSGTFVRSNLAIGRDGSNYVSESNPQNGSPVADFGYLDIFSTNGSTGTNTALYDRLASTMISTGSIISTSGTGTVPIKSWTKYDVDSDVGEVGNVCIEVGDVVQINNFGNTTGSTVLFKVTEYTIDFDRGVVDVKFGDRDIKEMNVISSLANTINRSL